MVVFCSYIFYSHKNVGIMQGLTECFPHKFIKNFFLIWSLCKNLFMHLYSFLFLMSSYLLITSGEKKVTHFYMFKRKKKKKTLESERCLWCLLTSLLILNTFCLLMKYSFQLLEFPINVKVSLTFIPGDHSAIVIERFIKLD